MPSTTDSASPPGLLGALRNMPLFKQRQLAAYQRRFLENASENLFMGRFDSFEGALAQVPKHKPTGYDNAESAKLAYTSQITSWDYPVLFWLQRAFGDGLTSVFDLGGHVGIKYYAFKRTLPFPAGLRWTVCDVPAVIKEGAEIATHRDPTQQLGFTSDYAQASGHDILLASGSLQYLPIRLVEILRTLPVKPRRILLNTTAAHTEETFYTVNSISTAFCAYRIQSWEELKEELKSAGYARVDTWQNDGKPIGVPFERGGDLAYYAGGYFQLQGG